MLREARLTPGPRRYPDDYSLIQIECRRCRSLLRPDALAWPLFRSLRRRALLRYVREGIFVFCWGIDTTGDSGSRTSLARFCNHVPSRLAFYSS